MKIAILHSGDLNTVSPGGISQYIEKLIKYNENNQIVVFGTSNNTENLVLGHRYKRKVSNKEYEFIPISNNKKRPLSLYYFFCIFKYFTELKKCDIIYAQRMEYALPFTFSKLKRKLIMSIHGSGLYSYIYWGKIIGTIYNLLERVAIRNSRKVIVLLKREEFGLPYYKKKYKTMSDKFFYGKVPIDTEVFRVVDKKKCRKEIGINSRDTVLIYFGRIDNRPKRILLLPQIVNECKKKGINIKCIVIGDGEDCDSLKKLIEFNKLENNFMLLGKLPHGDELIKYINSADISIILSTFEGICMSALESLACGVPVISTDVGDIKEYINGGFNGYIVNNDKDNETVANVVEKISEYSYGHCIEINDKYSEYKADIVIDELTKLFREVIES